MVTNKSHKSYLVVSVNPHRRAFVAEALRAVGAVSVEAVSFQRARAILRQFRFDVLAIDFIGLGAGAVDFLDDLNVVLPETPVIVLGPPVDGHMIARLRARRLINRDRDARPNQPVLQIDDIGMHYDDDRDGSDSARSERADRNGGLGGNGRQE